MGWARRIMGNQVRIMTTEDSHQGCPRCGSPHVGIGHVGRDFDVGHMWCNGLSGRPGSCPATAGMAIPLDSVEVEELLTEVSDSDLLWLGLDPALVGAKKYTTSGKRMAVTEDTDVCICFGGQSPSCTAPKHWFELEAEKQRARR